MLQTGDKSPRFVLEQVNGEPLSFDAEGEPALLVFFETDCPTCRLTIPYLNRLAKSNARIIGISQDNEAATRELAEQLPIEFPVVLDHELHVSRAYDPVAVPTLFLVGDGKVLATEIGFDKLSLNKMARIIAEATGLEPMTVAPAFDGAPQSKPGCASRHLEPVGEGDIAQAANPYATRGSRASRVTLDDSVDPFEYCVSFGDPLPVVPPTVERVDRMLKATPLAPDEIVALIPPNYGAATAEKIAANAVMAGCKPAMMRVLIPLIRAVCDERFNIHGVQATTHFAAPLVIVNGPIRSELGFVSGGNVFSNVARANSTLGRALQLILTNLGGARPGEIDMSTLGNPGKFSYCIAENEEANPWEPLHVELGFQHDESTVTLFAAEPPRGVSEHNARDARGVLKAISRALATSWTYRLCAGIEALVVLCPEHVTTIAREGFTKQDVCEYLFTCTGIPVKHFEDGGGEGTAHVRLYKQSMIDGESCYLKFQDPAAIKLLVAGGSAGKFSAVVSSWAAGPRGSQMVTYPVAKS
jgi:thiol-disulfide isomerase/thioredoxin